MATKKFNMDSYRESLKAANEKINARLVEIKNMGRRSWEVYKEAQELEWQMGVNTLMMNPQYMCEYMYSDRHAYEVLRMVSEKVMVVRRLKAKRVDDNGMSDSQDYAFTQDESSPEITLRLHKDGLWYDGCRSRYGITEEPYEYFDFSF